MSNILSITNIHKEYKAKKELPVKALNGLSLEVNRGEFMAICGVSGSGKSTLLHLISGVLKPDSGEIIFCDENNNEINVVKSNPKQAAIYRNQHIGYVLQDFGLIPYRSVRENIAVPLYINGESRATISKKITKITNDIGIEELINRPISKLSGGQKQRVAIARALVNNPEIILADEPTGALDSKTKNEILSLFKTLSEKGKTIIMVTHDPEAAALCDRIITIKDGLAV